MPKTITAELNTNEIGSFLEIGEFFDKLDKALEGVQVAATEDGEAILIIKVKYVEEKEQSLDEEED